MLPYLHYRINAIPMYTVTAILGVLAVLLYFNRLKIEKNRIELVLIWGLAGGLFGAKTLYLLQCFPEFISDIPTFFSAPKLFLEKYFNSGLVYYGGLFGCILSVLLACRLYCLRFDSLGQVIPAIPLFHAFGRIGCFCVGCCYGIPCKFGVAFRNSPIAPNGIPLFPVQLFEATVEFLLFFVLAKFNHHGNGAKRVIGLYFVLYGILRFFLEFLRGDEYRGFLAMLSVSQWFSLFTLALGSALLTMQRRERGSVN